MKLNRKARAFLLAWLDGPPICRNALYPLQQKRCGDFASRVVARRRLPRRARRLVTDAGMYWLPSPPLQVVSGTPGDKYEVTRDPFGDVFTTYLGADR